MKTENNPSLIFFKKYCNEEWLPLIQLHQENRHVQKNEAFIREGEAVKGIYFLNKGKAKITSHFSTSEERIFRLANERMLIGHRSLFLKTYTVSAVALTPCEVSFLPMNLFLQLVKANSAFAIYILEFFSRELRESEEQQFVLTMDNVRQRIAYSLLKLLRIFGYEKKGSQRLAFTLSRKDLAILGNTTYESVIRTLSVFEKEKLIECIGKDIAILNEHTLNLIAHGK